MERLYRLGKAGVAEVRASVPDPPTYPAVRGMPGPREEKGHVRHQREGMRYVYSPVIAPVKARQSALKHLVSTLFEGPTPAAAAALLEMSDDKLPAAERDQLSALIARREGEGR